LDPDEQLSESLKIKLREVVEENIYNAVNIPRKNIIFDKWISHSNWWPDQQIRFFKKGAVSWPDTIHTYPEVSGAILNLPVQESLAILHFNYSSINEFIEKQNRYSTIEANNRLKSRENFSWFKFFWWPIREFLVRYIKHFGFLDGIHGLVLVYLMMFYKMMVVVKMKEMK
ncbi:MAG TPA: glycosyltransferase family 2 protein, partial [Alphaproteobacteria bacterium]|nr:glycosyltransferase family 2 protein [Alphaproteobacteria bacterium]